jgi:hypothetical protein
MGKGTGKEMNYARDLVTGVAPINHKFKGLYRDYK